MRKLLERIETLRGGHDTIAAQARTIQRALKRTFKGQQFGAGTIVDIGLHAHGQSGGTMPQPASLFFWLTTDEAEDEEIDWHSFYVSVQRSYDHPQGPFRVSIEDFGKPERYPRLEGPVREDRVEEDIVAFLRGAQTRYGKIAKREGWA